MHDNKNLHNIIGCILYYYYIIPMYIANWKYVALVC